MPSVLPAPLPFTLGEAATPTEPKEAKGTATWEWLLCDGYGNPMAELTTATGKQITFKRNYYTEAQCVISHQDDAAYPLLAAVKTGPLPTLRCYRRAAGESSAILRFNGYLAPFQETLEEAGLINLVFRSPFGRLIGDGGASNGRYIGQGLTAEEKYADQIAASLIRLYGGAAALEGRVGETDSTFNESSYVGVQAENPVGLKVGEIGQTKLIADVGYKYANVGQAIIYLSQMTGGFDFTERFVNEGTTMAYFDTHDTLGERRPEALFQYGPGTLANIRKVERTTSSPLNYVRLMGSSGVVAETKSEMQESIEAYGLWFTQQQAIGTAVLSTLEARALGLRRAQPVKTFKLEPDVLLRNCPKPWDDYFLGDTVSFYGRRGAFEDSVLARVNEIQVVVDENGYEAASIPAAYDPRQPDELHMTLELETGNTN